MKVKFKPPVGNSADRNNFNGIWPQGWRLGPARFCVKYSLDNGTPMGWHTGLDFFRSTGRTQGQPVHSIGPGEVKFAGVIPGTSWGETVVIYHGIVKDGDEKPHEVFSRYGHLQDISDEIKPGVIVSDQQIGTIGSGPKKYKMPAHLHFDICKTKVLYNPKSPVQAAGHWPGVKGGERGVRDNYVDPGPWLKQEHILIRDASNKDVVEELGSFPPQSATSIKHFVTFTTGTSVYKDHSISAVPDGQLDCNDSVYLEQEAWNGDGFHWGHISGGKFHDRWLKLKKLDGTETYVSTNPPQ